MENKNIITFIGALAIVVLAMSAVYYYNQQIPSQQGTTVTLSYDPKTQGKVVFGITDHAEDINGVSSIFITVNKIEIHSEANGWATVSNETKQYDLLALKQSGAVSLLANANINVGTYDQVRLMVDKIVVVKNGVEEEAKLPSGELKMMQNIVVNADKTVTVVFDFIADKSLHITGNGKFIFTPVIKVKKTSNASLELTSDNEITILGGDQEDDEDFGMDEKGEVKNNFELEGNLEIDDKNEIWLEGKLESDGEIDNELVLNFTAQNDSGLSGTATLEEEDGSVKVTLKLKNTVLGILAAAKPAHIHLGSCANIGGVKYPLNSAVNGKSETMLNVSLADLKAQLPLAINVHKSVAEANVYVACTDVKF